MIPNEFTKEQFKYPPDYVWRAGIWTNYGYDDQGFQNICARHVAFLCRCIRKPTFKFLYDNFPSLKGSRVRIGSNLSRPIRNSDFVIFSNEEEPTYRDRGIYI